MNAIQQATPGNSDSAAIYRQLQAAARDVSDREGRSVSTQELLTRHALESFLDRLNQTPHGDDFVLKGGILLAAYGIRRPTKDIDAEAVSTDLSPENLMGVVADIASVPADDGVMFDLDSVTVDQIREGAQYAGLRLKVTTTIATAKVVVAWDVSAGDPIVPGARVIEVPRVLGSPVRMLGYAPETIIAEKGVTILQRGTTSTRWRDYVDIVQVARIYELDRDTLIAALTAVAQYRDCELEPTAPTLEGYGAIEQTKWSAWRRKAGVEALSEESLDEQMQLVSKILDPIMVAARG